jgi:hypothetical protein
MAFPVCSAYLSFLTLKAEDDTILSSANLQITTGKEMGVGTPTLYIREVQICQIDSSTVTRNTV